MSRYETQTSDGIGVVLFSLARYICIHEPGVSVFGKGKNQTMCWVPPTDEPFPEHIELRSVKFAGEAQAPDIWQAEFVIGGYEAEAMLVFAALTSQLDGDPYVLGFTDRYSTIYDTHQHDLCLSNAAANNEPDRGTRLVTVGRAVSQEVALQ